MLDKKTVQSLEDVYIRKKGQGLKSFMVLICFRDIAWGDDGPVVPCSPKVIKP